MTYRIYRMQFYSGVHFGDDAGTEHVSSAVSVFHSDTLFSALCIEALHMGGEAALQELVSANREGKMVVSDLFPYSGDTYFLPKPKKLYNRKESMSEEKTDRKLVKKLTHLSADCMEDYLSYQQGKTDTFDMKPIVEQLAGVMRQERRMSTSLRGAQAESYYIGTAYFQPGCGLYAIVGSEQPEQIDMLFSSLEMTGIGGRKTYGLGKFRCERLELSEQSPHGLGVLYRRLTAKNGAVYMTLNTSLPQDDELDCLQDESAAYLLIRRGGMTDGSVTEHKQTLYALEAGSCVAARYRGQIADVRTDKTTGHPVYRALTPLFLGVE